MKRSRTPRLLIAAGVFLLSSVGVMVLIAVLGGVYGTYVGFFPSQVSQLETFYGLVGMSATSCPTGVATTCTVTPIYFLSGFKDLPCLHVSNASNACWNQAIVTQYHLVFPVAIVQLPKLSPNIVQVNGTLTFPSTLGTTLAPGGDIYVSDWKNYVIYTAPKSSVPTTSTSCSKGSKAHPCLSIVSGISVQILQFNVDIILVILPTSVGCALIILGGLMLRKTRKQHGRK